MKASSVIDQVIGHLSSSPMRLLNDAESEIPNLSINQQDLSRLLEQAYLYRSKLKTPLHIALMGEVKAGKSTLINCLAKASAAPTDVLEATAVVSRISHGDPCARIVYTDGTVLEDSPERVYAALTEHQASSEYAQTVSIVEISLPLDGLLDLTLVDTPGLATMTQANVKRARDFAKEADVILWVFNANHLGQSDIEDELERVAALGKPIVAIINRIDEIDGDPERLVKYLRRETGYYLRNIFALSAKQAFTGIASRNDTAVQASGYAALLHYLKEEIQGERDAVHLESIMSSVASTLRHDSVAHQSLGRALGYLHTQSAANENEVELAKNRVQESMLAQVRDAADRFLKDEEDRNMRNHPKGSFLSSIMPGKRDDSEAIIRQNLQRWSEEYWRDELSYLQQVFQEKWNMEMDQVARALDASAQNFNTQEKGLILSELGNDEAAGGIFTAAGKGAMFASVGATGLAFYAAVLGPAAAYVTMGAALAAFVPPIAIFGAVVGAIAAFATRGSRARAKKQSIQHVFSEVRERCRKEFVEAQLVPAIISNNYEAAKLVRSEFDRKIYGDLARDGVERLIVRVDEYLRESDNLLGLISRATTKG